MINFSLIVAGLFSLLDKNNDEYEKYFEDLSKFLRLNVNNVVVYDNVINKNVKYTINSEDVLKFFEKIKLEVKENYDAMKSNLDRNASFNYTTNKTMCAMFSMLPQCFIKTLFEELYDRQVTEMLLNEEPLFYVNTYSLYQTTDTKERTVFLGTVE